MTHLKRPTPTTPLTPAKIVTLTLATGTLLLGLTGCTAEEPEPLALSTSAAADRYLGIVCPINEQWDRLDLAVDTLRIAAATDPAASTTAVTQQAVAVLARNTAALEALNDDAFTWPTEATPALTAVAAALEEEAPALQQLTEARTPQDVWSISWPQAGDSPAQARAALGLPDTPEENCAQHHEADTSEDPGDGEPQTSPPEGSPASTASPAVPGGAA